MFKAHRVAGPKGNFAPRLAPLRVFRSVPHQISARSRRHCQAAERGSLVQPAVSEVGSARRTSRAQPSQSNGFELRRTSSDRRPGSGLICNTALPHHLGSSSTPDTGRSEGAAAAWRWFYAFFKFSRPHTMLGTFISVLSVSLLALVCLFHSRIH